MVDGVLASCYADVPHDLAHLSMLPILWSLDAIDWILGYDPEFPVYVTIQKDLSNMSPAAVLRITN